MCLLKLLKVLIFSFYCPKLFLKKKKKCHSHVQKLKEVLTKPLYLYVFINNGVISILKLKHTFVRG